MKIKITNKKATNPVFRDIEEGTAFLKVDNTKDVFVKVNSAESMNIGCSIDCCTGIKSFVAPDQEIRVVHITNMDVEYV